MYARVSTDDQQTGRPAGIERQSLCNGERIFEDAGIPLFRPVRKIPPRSLFLVWFASLAERPALRKNDTTLDLQHESVVPRLIQSIGAIQQMMEGAGFAPRPALQSLLTSYPRDLKGDCWRRRWAREAAA